MFAISKQDVFRCLELCKLMMNISPSPFLHFACRQTRNKTNRNNCEKSFFNVYLCIWRKTLIFVVRPEAIPSSCLYLIVGYLFSYMFVIFYQKKNKTITFNGRKIRLRRIVVQTIFLEFSFSSQFVFFFVVVKRRDKETRKKKRVSRESRRMKRSLK